MAHITATLKREIARTDHGDLHLSDLLSSGARQRIETLRRGGIGTVVLDECHHLASLWGYLVWAAIADLGAVHLVALTATPPDALTEEEAALYSTLLADYDRFVRKHLHLFAPSEDGAIEAGPSHVHPALGPFAPPPGSSFDEINREMTRRSAGHEQARDRWGIGQPYTGTEQQTLVILPRRQRRARQIATQPPRYRLSQKGPLVLAGLVAALVLVITVATGRPLVLAGLAAALALLGWAAWRLAGVRRVLADALPLDLVAHAICDAYHDLGELSGQAAGSLAIEPRASGYLRCYLPAATAAESVRFTSALDGALSPADFPRYLISRLVPTRGGGLAPLARVLSRQPPFDHRWVAVPEDLGRSKKRADAYTRAWQRWLGPGELQFTQRTPEGREAAATASAQTADYQTSSRRIWV